MLPFRQGRVPAPTAVVPAFHSPYRNKADAALPVEAPLGADIDAWADAGRLTKSTAGTDRRQPLRLDRSDREFTLGAGA